MGPSLKEKCAEIRTCGSHEQCTGPTEKTQMHIFSGIQTQPYCF